MAKDKDKNPVEGTRGRITSPPPPKVIPKNGRLTPPPPKPSTSRKGGK